jgi:hypothetical protein
MGKRGRLARIEDSALVDRTPDNLGHRIALEVKPRDFPPSITPGACGEEDPLAHWGGGLGTQNRRRLSQYSTRSPPEVQANFQGANLLLAHQLRADIEPDGLVRLDYLLGMDGDQAIADVLIALPQSDRREHAEQRQEQEKTAQHLILHCQ